MDKKKVFAVVFNDLRNDNRVLNQAFSLAAAGHDVTLMGVQRKTLLPLEEEVNGVKIIRKRMRSQWIERIRFVRFVYFQMYVWMQVGRQAMTWYDVIHCHDLNTLQFGALMKVLKLGKVKLIYDAHEYETQRNGLYGWRKVYAKIKERFLIKFCAGADWLANVQASFTNQLSFDANCISSRQFAIFILIIFSLVLSFFVRYPQNLWLSIEGISSGPNGV